MNLACAIILNILLVLQLACANYPEKNDADTNTNNHENISAQLSCNDNECLDESKKKAEEKKDEIKAILKEANDAKQDIDNAINKVDIKMLRSLQQECQELQKKIEEQQRFLSSKQQGKHEGDEESTDGKADEIGAEQVKMFKINRPFYHARKLFDEINLSQEKFQEQIIKKFAAIDEKFSQHQKAAFFLADMMQKIFDKLEKNDANYKEKIKQLRNDTDALIDFIQQEFADSDSESQDLSSGEGDDDDECDS